VSQGITHTSGERVALYPEHDPLILESGTRLAPVEVAFETYGQLNASASNVVFVCHALTGDAHAAGPGGWWSTLVGPGQAVDTDRFFVISPNLLGGCRGSTGPASIDPATGEPYHLDFPLFSVRDLVTVHRRLLEQLGIPRVHAVIGGSLGGMQGLQWALDTPSRVDRVVMIAASARLSAQNIALSAVARAAILEAEDPVIGMSLARRIGHITYLSDASMAAKFGAARVREGAPMTLAEDFEVERYLRHQGESFTRRFDPWSYLYLTRVMDYFDPFANPGPDLGAVADARTRFLALSFSTDWRFGPEHSENLVHHLRAGQVDARHVTIDSPAGHDSFLLDIPDYHREVADFLQAP
jgi:homoserine O-acetyltransferase